MAAAFPALFPASTASSADRRRRRTTGTARRVGRRHRALRLVLLASLSAAGGPAPVHAQQAGGPLLSSWSPAWVDGGFWSGRSWVWGWYKANPAVWSWWSGRAAAWGVSGLSSAATLTAVVNQAIAARATLITVPQTDLRLDFGSVRAVRPMAARFVWMAADGAVQQAAADCQSGELNGAPPADLRQAQLLNAACHVVYGAP